MEELTVGVTNVDAEPDEAVTSEIGDETAEGAPESDAEDIGEALEAELAQLKEIFPELSGVEDITGIKNPMRYAALRDLGLSPTEAYLAARGPQRTSDNRSHLRTSVPRGMGRGTSMPPEELARAREIFYGMSDSEIQRLWKKVTK